LELEGWESLQATNTDIRDVKQAREDLAKMCLRVLDSEDGKKLMEWLRTAHIEHPVAVPGADPSYAFYREGQCSVVRDLEARIKYAKEIK
jgi:hypothetical protein